MGESKDLKGNDNDIAEEIRSFKKKLETKLDMEVIYEPEFYTSLQASRLQGEGAMLDASAAAIILQSYLDKYKENK
jgi:RNase H-fold protein (predicted Holliday junction resolvase)